MLTSTRLWELLQDPYSVTAEEVKWLVQNLGAPEVLKEPHRPVVKQKTRTVYRTVYKGDALAERRAERIEAELRDDIRILKKENERLKLAARAREQGFGLAEVLEVFEASTQLAEMMGRVG